MKSVLLGLFVSACCFANARIQGDCTQGGNLVVTQGTSSTTRVQQSFVNLSGGNPVSGCTVNVYITGSGGTLAVLSTNTQASTANPFTADATGHWYFEVANGIYDVTLSNAGIPTPFTLGAIDAINPQEIAGVAFADTFIGADACARITAAIAALTAQNGIGGTVDARGLTGILPCATNPFGTAQGSVTLLLGLATYQAAVPWVVPNKSRLLGLGRGDPPGEPSQNNTVIQAQSGFPTATAVVSLCSALTCSGVEVEALTIDCNNVSGCIGGQNSYSQEKSWFRNILVVNNPGDGFLVNYGSQNSGPYNDLEVLPESAGVALTTCFHINVTGGIGISAFRGINGITCNGSGYSIIPTNAIFFEGLAPGEIHNVHCEHVTNCITLGSASEGGASDVDVFNVETGPENATSVLLPSGSGTQNITVCGVANSTSGGNVIVDQINSNTLLGATAGVGCYITGSGASGQQTVITTRRDTPVNFQTAMLLLKSLTIPGTNTGADNGSICLGPGVSFCFYGHESNTPGVPGPVIKTQNLGIVVQNGQVANGVPGGGMFLNGNGFGTDPTIAQIAGGVSSDTGTFTARGTGASFLQFHQGIIDFYGDTGLTPGATYSPTKRLSIVGTHINTNNNLPDFTGQITVSSATTGTHNFTNAYTQPPLCVITPVSDPGSRFWVTTTTTGVTANLSTTGSVTFGYVCVGTPN